jgi:hypothetical protein
MTNRRTAAATRVGRRALNPWSRRTEQCRYPQSRSIRSRLDLLCASLTLRVVLWACKQQALLCAGADMTPAPACGIAPKPIFYVCSNCLSRIYFIRKTNAPANHFNNICIVHDADQKTVFRRTRTIAHPAGWAAPGKIRMKHGRWMGLAAGSRNCLRQATDSEPFRRGITNLREGLDRGAKRFDKGLLGEESYPELR